MSRAIAILWLGAGSFLVSASSPQVELALFRTCGRLSLRRTKRRSSLPPLWFHCFCRDGSPSVRETGKRDGCRVAKHGPIGDSWPIAFFGHPRGHRVFIETRCLRHTGPTTAFDTLPRNRASQQSDGSPPRMIPRKKRLAV